MIRCIAAIDSKNGIASENGIPWAGKVPSDIAHFRAQTRHGIVVMGYRTYTEFDKPLSERRNFVVTRSLEPLRAGFEPLTDVKTFLKETNDDVWVIGGAGLFKDVIDLVDELDLTLIDGDFGCTKFFPSFSKSFRLKRESTPVTENGITFRFTLWAR